MKDKILKNASYSAMITELENLPEEESLGKTLAFSPEFEEKIKDVFSYIKKNYFEFSGMVIPKKYVLALLGAAIFLLAPLSRSLAGMGGIVRATPAVLLIVLRQLRRNMYTTDSRSFNPSGQMQPGYMFYDTDRGPGTNSNYRELDYVLPAIPREFVLKSEGRTVARHTAEFTNDKGDVVYYEKTTLRNTVMPKIPRETVEPVKTPVEYKKGVYFIDDGVSHLLFEDDFFRTHYYGKISKERILRFAFGENK